MPKNTWRKQVQTYKTRCKKCGKVIHIRYGRDTLCSHCQRRQRK